MYFDPVIWILAAFWVPQRQWGVRKGANIMHERTHAQTDTQTYFRFRSIRLALKSFIIDLNQSFQTQKTA